MGNSIQRKVAKIKSRFMSSQASNQDPKINQTFQCPSCGQVFGHKTLRSQVHLHLRECLQQHVQEEQNEQQMGKVEEMVPSMHEEIVLNYNIEEYLYIKQPVDDLCIKFKWRKAPIKVLQNFIFNFSPDQIKNLSFQQKSAWFRYHLQKHRINWMNGADHMRIQKSNVLMTSLLAAKKVNMYKQVKIQFVGDKVNDAGGLLRQWMHMVISEMFDQSTGIFKLCKTDDCMYRLKWDEDVDEQFSGELLILYGMILGKAIFQKIPVSAYLDRTILRQLAFIKNQVKLQDIFGYDKQLYSNWTYILQNQIDQLGLDLYFVMTKQNEQNSTLDLIELVQGGKDIQVSDQNKKMFVDLSISTLCQQKVSRSIGYIKKGLHRVIPEQLLKIFEPYQLQMMLYGVPYIDVKDWHKNTEYKGDYNQSHKVIRWFWEVVQKFNQQQLANLLKFSTGSSRTPIHGFKRLQSNRGNYSRFLIQSAPLDKINPYPKGHTCFNRLELPRYNSKQELSLYVTAIVNNKLDGVFGLD